MFKKYILHKYDNEKKKYINEIIRKVFDRKQTLQNDTKISQRIYVIDTKKTRPIGHYDTTIPLNLVANFIDERLKY